jgi:hypothetical protein
MENPAEVQELRNKLRMLKFPQDEILNVVRRQQRAIQRQRQANETVRGECNQYELQITQMQKLIDEHKSSEELQRLQQQQKSLQNRLSVLGADLSVETNKEKKLNEEVSRANSRSGGIFKQLRDNEELEARVRTMENRLDKALLRYNKGLQKLVALRSELDEMRKDRMNFRSVLSGAEHCRQQKDRELGQLIGASNEAYSTRDEKKMKLVRLKNAEKQDVTTYQERLDVLNQQIEGQRLTQGHPIDAPGSLRSRESTVGGPSDQHDELQALTDQYQVTIQLLLEKSGMKEVSDLFAEAERLERENFSLYTYVVDHGATKMKLQEDIDGLDLQRKALLAQTEEGEGQQSEELEKLTNEIQTVDSDLTAIREQKTRNENEFTSVYVQINKLMNLLGCPWDEAPDAKTTATPANAFHCLSLIEAVIADKVKTVYEKAKQECTFKDIKPASFLTDERPEIGSTRSTLRLADKEIAGKVAEASRPLTVEELRSLVE